MVDKFGSPRPSSGASFSMSSEMLLSLTGLSTIPLSRQSCSALEPRVWVLAKLTVVEKNIISQGIQVRTSRSRYFANRGFGR